MVNNRRRRDAERRLAAALQPAVAAAAELYAPLRRGELGSVSDTLPLAEAMDGIHRAATILENLKDNA